MQILVLASLHLLAGFKSIGNVGFRTLLSCGEKAQDLKVERWCLMSLVSWLLKGGFCLSLGAGDRLRPRRLASFDFWQLRGIECFFLVKEDCQLEALVL